MSVFILRSKDFRNPLWFSWECLWKTSIVFVDKGIKVDAKYYQDHLLAVLILKMSDLAGDNHYVFMQDVAIAHTAKTTPEYFNRNVYIKPSSWPPNSPDL